MASSKEKKKQSSNHKSVLKKMSFINGALALSGIMYKTFKD